MAKCSEGLGMWQRFLLEHIDSNMVQSEIQSTNKNVSSLR